MTKYLAAKIGPSVIEAICPKCEQYHKAKDLNWTGETTPRIFCDNCKRLVDYIDGRTEYYKTGKKYGG